MILKMEMIYESGIDGGPGESSIMKHSTYKSLDKTRISLSECQAKATTSGPGTYLLWTNCVPWWPQVYAGVPQLHTGDTGSTLYRTDQPTEK